MQFQLSNKKCNQMIPVYRLFTK